MCMTAVSFPDYGTCLGKGLHPRRGGGLASRVELLLCGVGCSAVRVLTPPPSQHQVGPNWRRGNFKESKEASRRSALCSTLGITFGIIMWVIAFFALVLIGLFVAIDWKLRCNIGETRCSP